MESTIVSECPCDSCGTALLMRVGIETQELTYVDFAGVVRCLVCGEALMLQPIGSFDELPLLYVYHDDTVLFA